MAAWSFGSVLRAGSAWEANGGGGLSASLASSDLPDKTPDGVSSSFFSSFGDCCCGVGLARHPKVQQRRATTRHQEYLILLTTFQFFAYFCGLTLREFSGRILKSQVCSKKVSSLWRYLSRNNLAEEILLVKLLEILHYGRCYTKICCLN